MATNWQQIIDEIKTFRAYYNALPASADAYKKKAYFVSKEDLFALLSQKNDGTLLDGVRVYFGASMIDGNMVPTLHAVACEKDDATGKMNDYGIGDATPPSTLMAADVRPCPIYCSTSNILNK